MARRTKVFPSVVRHIVLSTTTYDLLVAEAQYQNKYIGELADELLREGLLDYAFTQARDVYDPPPAAVRRRALKARRQSQRLRDQVRETRRRVEEAI